MHLNRHIVITGIPASGKSTVGLIIARRINLEFLDKDEILESLFETKGIGDAEWRSKLSRESDRLLEERAMNSDGAVIVSWWRHPLSKSTSGTPVDWLSQLTSNVVEVYCTCDPTVAATRFQQRRRHDGHLDRNKLHSDLVESFKEQAAFGPLGIGRLIKVDTNQEIDEQDLICVEEIYRTTK